MTRKELYEKMFGCPPAACPTDSCSDCPVNGSCDNNGWWNTEIPDETVPFARTEDEISLSEDDRQKICDLYNTSDLDCLEYIKKNVRVTPSMSTTIDILIMNNRLIFQYNDENYMEKEYRIKYKRILRMLGIHINRDDKAVPRKE